MNHYDILLEKAKQHSLEYIHRIDERSPCPDKEILDLSMEVYYRLPMLPNGWLIHGIRMAPFRSCLLLQHK